MKALLKKEINSFLASVLGYIAITTFLVITGLFLWVFPIEFNILDFGYAQLDSLFIVAPFIFLFLIPAITMKSFADEKKTGTIELLMTKPISDLQIIGAKFWASFILFFISVAPTLIYYFSVYFLGFPKGDIDTGAVIGSYIGLLFIGAAFISIGIFASSISNNQIVAFLISIFISGFLFLGFDFIYDFALFGEFDLLLKSIGMMEHYTSISRGLIDTRDIIYFLSIIALFLVFTKLSLESRKW